MKLRAGSFASRFAAFALLALVIWVAWLLIVAPFLTAHKEMASTMEHSRGLLNRYRALSAQEAQLAARFRALKKTATDAGAYITGPSNAAAAAALQKHVQSIVERVSGELHSSQVLPVEPVEVEIAVKRVALKLQLVVAINRLQDLFYELETAHPFVFIRDVSVSSVGESRHGHDPGTTPMLEVTLQLYGFARVQSITRSPTSTAVELSP